MAKKRKHIAKDKRFARRRILLLFAVLAVLAVSALGIFSLLKKNEAAGAMNELPFSSTAAYAYNGSGFLYTAGDKLCYKDLSDEKNDYTLTLGTTDVKLVATSALSALFNSAAVHIVGAEYPVEFSGQVIDVRCGTEHIAVLRQDNAGTAALQVFDANAAKMGQLDAGEATLIDFGFDSASGTEILWTLTMDTSGQVPVSTITTYRYEADKVSTTGIMTIQGQLVENVRFSKSSVFVTGTNNVVRYDMASNTESYRALIYGNKLIDTSLKGSKPLFVFAPRSDATLSTIKLVSLSEEELSNESSAYVQLPEGVLHAFAMNGRLAAFTKDKVYVYSASGTQVSETKLDYQISAAVKISETHVVLTSGAKMYIMAVK